MDDKYAKKGFAKVSHVGFENLNFFLPMLDFKGLLEHSASFLDLLLNVQTLFPFNDIHLKFSKGECLYFKFKAITFPVIFLLSCRGSNFMYILKLRLRNNQSYEHCSKYSTISYINFQTWFGVWYGTNSYEIYELCIFG